MLGDVYLLALFVLAVILLNTSTWYIDETVNKSNKIARFRQSNQYYHDDEKLINNLTFPTTSRGKIKDIGSSSLLMNKSNVMDHYILGLSNEEYLNTNVYDMISKYKFLTQNIANCDADFGNQLIKNWISKKALACSPTNQRKPGYVYSSIYTYLIHQTGHAGNGDNLILFQNIAVEMSLFTDVNFIQSIVIKYVQTKHNQQPYIPFPKGFIHASCETNQNFNINYFPGWNADWNKAVLTVSELPLSMCDEWVEHNVLVMQRDTFANFYHDSEDFVDVFLSMAILGWNLNNTQIYLTDLYPEGPFWEIWSQVFHGRYPPMTAWHLQQKYKHSNTSRVCFKNLAVGIYGPASPICLIATNSPCEGTALVKSYSDFVVRGLNLQYSTHYNQIQPLDTIIVTYMTRKSTPQWPERKYCNDTHSFFLCQYWETFGERSLGRMIVNEQELISAMKILETEPRNDKKRISIHVVNYNDLSLTDQIRQDITTDIMIGPHGAGLTHSAFMRDRARLVELFVDGSGGNRHFHNFARWYGRGYHEIHPTNPVDIQHVVSVLREAIHAIRIDSY